MVRLNIPPAARAVFVLLLTASLITGFSDPADLTTGTSVAATPTVGITGGASPDGTQVSGEVVALDTVQTPSVALLSTTAGLVHALLTESAMLKQLRLSMRVTFTGQYLSVNWFQAYQLVNGAGGGDLALGEPVGTAEPVKLGAPIGKNSSSCSSSQKLSLTPESGSGVIGKAYKVVVGLSGCAGKRVYLKVLSGPNSSLPAVFATVDSRQHASLSYTGTSAGQDTFSVWLDSQPQNANYDSGEPYKHGWATWVAP